MKPCCSARSHWPALLAGLALAAPFDAQATIILSLDLHQMVGRSDRIFVGKVIKVTSRWTPDRKRIVTDATVVVEQPVRGAKVGEQVVIRRLGGTVGGIGMRVAGTSVLRKAQRALLFTEQRRGHRYVVGMRQGLFRLRTIDGRTLVRRNLSGLSLVDRMPTGLRFPNTKDPSQLSEVPLKTMVSRVQDVIAACNKTPTRCRPLRAPGRKAHSPRHSPRGGRAR